MWSKQVAMVCAVDVAAWLQTAAFATHVVPTSGGWGTEVVEVEVYASAAVQDNHYVDEVMCVCVCVCVCLSVCIYTHIYTYI